MKTSISIGSAYYDGAHWDDLVDYVVQAERLGVDQAWSAEAWGMDAVVPLAYLAARTERIALGTGIMQITSRVPSMIAMTAQSLDTVSKGRFLLGLGVSGPQVVEGLHGAAFAKPLGRLKECLALIKKGLNGERMAFDGEHYLLPRPGGEGKAIKLSQPARPQLPIYLATLGPNALTYTGSIADGWLGTSFMPEHANIFLDPMRKGASSAGRSLADIDIQVGVGFEVSDHVEALIAKRKPALAFTLGGMGSAKTNFYNEAFSRAGYEDDAKAVQQLWVDRKKEAAIARVPDELVLKTNLIGTEAMIKERLALYRSAGVTGLRLQTTGDTNSERIAELEHASELVKAGA